MELFFLQQVDRQDQDSPHKLRFVVKVICAFPEIREVIQDLTAIEVIVYVIRAPSDLGTVIGRECSCYLITQLDRKSVV